MAFWEVTLGGLLGSGIATSVIGAMFARRLHRIEQQVAEEFRRRASREEYLRQALFELFGPVKMQLLRTKQAFRRWNERNEILESQVVRAGNMAIRDLLLAKGHLIPADLITHAEALVTHYDVWLEAFERERGKDGNGGTGASFVFVGPEGYGFPHGAEAAFLKRADELQRELYGADLT